MQAIKLGGGKGLLVLCGDVSCAVVRSPWLQHPARLYTMHVLFDCPRLPCCFWGRGYHEIGLAVSVVGCA